MHENNIINIEGLQSLNPLCSVCSPIEINLTIYIDIHIQEKKSSG